MAEVGVNAEETCPWDQDGFLTVSHEWSESVAALLADQEGLQLSDPHWEVIRFLRQYYERNRTAPTMRELRMGVGLSTAEMFGLFPSGGPLMQGVETAALPKPSGCK